MRLNGHARLGVSHHCDPNAKTRQRAAAIATQRSRAIQRVTTIASQTPRHASAPLPLRLNGHARFSESPPLRHKRQDTPARRCHCDSTVPPRLGPAHHCDPNTQTHQRAAAIATQRSRATRRVPPLRPKHPDTPARRCHCDTTVTRHSARRCHCDPNDPTPLTVSCGSDPRPGAAGQAPYSTKG